MLKDHLEKLDHFVGSVRAGSIRKYAISHRLSQPAVSKCIQNLEAELEISLLIRERDGVHLTKAGKELYDFADRVLSDSDRVESRLRSYGKLRVSGSLTLGTYQSVAVYFVPSFFKFIRRAQPDLALNLYCASSRDLVDALRSGRVDFTISIDPPESRETFRVPIMKDTYSLYRQAGFSGPVERSLIFTLPTAAGCDGKTLRSFLVDARLDGRVSSCAEFESVKSMAEQGVGYALMPDRVAKPLLESGRIELAPAKYKLNHIGEHNIVFACRKHRAADVTIKWLLDQVLLTLRRS